MELTERRKKRERLALTNKVKEEEHLRDLRGVKTRDRNENVSTRLNGLRENADSAVSCRGPGPARKKRYTSSREEAQDGAQMCPCARAIE